jgi:hypothetical protein
MYMNVQNICIRNQAAWNTVTAFSNSYGSFSGVVNDINSLNKQLQNNSKGITDTKKQLKKTMAEKTMVLVGAMKAYANFSQVTTLAGVISTTSSTITSAKDVDADDICLNIVDKATSVLPQLADFGTTQVQIDAAVAAINAFVGTIGKPKTEIVLNKTYNEQVASLFKEADSLLSGQLDGMILRFKEENENFHNEYLNARKIGGYSSVKKEETTEAEGDKKEA